MQFPRLILVQSELGPQINPADLVVGGQAVGRAALENDAAVHDVGAIGDAERFADVVIGDEHADAAVPQVKDDLLDVGDGNRIDAGKRLVEQDELRRDDERARDFRAPPLAARQRVGRRLRQRREIQLGEQLPQPRAPRAPRQSIVSRMARMFCSTVRPRKIEGSCGR